MYKTTTLVMLVSIKTAIKKCKEIVYRHTHSDTLEFDDTETLAVEKMFIWMKAIQKESR